MDADERVWTPSEILERYKRGERDFHELDISDGVTDKTSFRGAVLDGADFSRCFIEADFSGARLRGCRFVRANVKTCMFDGADLQNADFSEAPIDGASFTDCKFEGASFEGAGAYGYTFKKGELPP
jgi:serine/threonine-protein kinase